MGTSQAKVSGDEKTMRNVLSSSRMVLLMKNLVLLSQIFLIALDLKNLAIA